MWIVWTVSLWTIHDIPLMDRYGFTQNHPNFTMDIEDNYVHTLPSEAIPMAMAIQYGEQWGIDWRDVLNMPYSTFYKAVNVQKAINYKRPWWQGELGEQAFMYEKVSNKRLNKPNKRTHNDF